MNGADSNFLRACRGEAVEQIPVWFMRQAGRSLPEYRALRRDESILEAIRHPELAAEITLQPVKRYGVDAAILFSDIVVPLVAIGVGIEIEPGRGPVIDQPFRAADDLKRLRAFEPPLDAPYVAETVKALRSALDVPLIGFAGAPFTLASYLIEGGPSRTFLRTKDLMRSDPSTWFALIDALADITIASLRDQVAAGAQAIQLFDSWAGALSRFDYEHFVYPSSERIFHALSEMGVPKIHFGVGTGELLDLFARAGADVVGVDWRVPLPAARTRCGAGVALQGNLDPAICLSSFPILAEEARRVLAEGTAAPGYIFNLGHGVLPETDPENLGRLVELVHSYPTGAAS